MKKIIIVLITLSLIIGIFWSIRRDKKIKQEVETFIKQDQHMVISIIYPKTNQPKLDQKLKQQIEQIYDAFMKEHTINSNSKERSELNVDYKYNKVNNRYLNIVLDEFINSNQLAHPITKRYTYVFDTKENRFLTIEDLMTKEEAKKLTIRLQKQLIKEYPNCVDIKLLSTKITPEYKNLTNFTFTSEDLTFYFNPYEISPGYCGMLQTTVPLDQLNLKIDIELGEEEKKTEKVTKLTTKTIDPNKKMIAITFDDGPSKYTKDILSILKKYDACATFFVLGNKVEIYDESTREIIKQGSEIGNHSYNHKWLIKLKKDEFMDQVNMTQDIIERTTGFRPTLLRPTYGDVNDVIKKNTDLDIVLWNVDTLDWKIKKPKRIASRVIGKVKDGDIILMHDTHKQTVEALKLILPELKKQGFQFVTVSELKEARIIDKLNVTK